MLPEFFIECIGEFILFVSRFRPQFWLASSRQMDELVTLLTRLLDRPALLKNPYIRSKFVDFLFGWTVTDQLGRLPLEHLFDMFPVLVEHLPRKMMRFYIGICSDVLFDWVAESWMV